MIKLMFSKRHKRKVYRLDAKVNGKRFRRFFFRRSDAEAVAYKIKHDEVARRYGLPVMAERPFLSDLIEKRLEAIKHKDELTRATRILHGLLAVLPQGYCVDELTKADVQKYVDKRKKDGLKPQSINRELTTIGSMMNQIDIYYPQLEQWRPPKMPKQKVVDGRRDRVWETDEIASVLEQLFAPPMKGEQPQAALARHRTGKKVSFCLMSGVRHGEMAAIRKTDINWQSRTVRIKQSKTGKYKTIGPLAETSIEILKEFYEASETEFVFNRGGKINRRIYKILKAACLKAGVAYGADTINGLVLHDARHTATTHLLESGINPRTIQEWMGWANSSFVMYYAHASKKSRERAGRALEELAGKKSA
jgi:site-specific recombinase XerD